MTSNVLSDFLTRLENIQSPSLAWQLAQESVSQLPQAHALVAALSPALDSFLIDHLLEFERDLAVQLADNPALDEESAAYLCRRLIDILVPPKKRAQNPASAKSALDALRTLAARSLLSSYARKRLLEHASTKPDSGSITSSGQALRVMLDIKDLDISELTALADRQEAWSLTAWFAIHAHPAWPQPETWNDKSQNILPAGECDSLLQSFPEIVERSYVQDWLVSVRSPDLDDALVRAARRYVADPLFTDFFNIFVRRDPFLAARALRSVPSAVMVMLEPADLKPLLTHADRKVREIGLLTIKRISTYRQLQKSQREQPSISSSSKPGL